MTARVLVDQCVGRRMIQRALGGIAEVAFIADIAPGASDHDVLTLARETNRILITEDFDFGELIFKFRAPAPVGIIHLVLSRMPIRQRESKFAAEARELLSAADGHFVVFSRGPIRSRPFPSR